MLLFYSYMITSEASCWIKSKYVAMTYGALRLWLFYINNTISVCHVPGRQAVLVLEVVYM